MLSAYPIDLDIMRLNLDWINDPAIDSYEKLNSKLFFTKDAKANGFDAGSEVLAACKLFLEEVEQGYRPSFTRIRPFMAIRTAGVILHRLMDFYDVARDEISRTKQVIQLLDFLTNSCNDTTKGYAHLAAFEYADFLRLRGGPGLPFFCDFLVEHAETRQRRTLLKTFLIPKVHIVGYDDSCLYPEIYKAVERRANPATWFAGYFSQKQLIGFYDSARYPILKTLMGRKGRGQALEIDLGM